VKDDYFIVEGIRKDELRDRQILYRWEYKSLVLTIFLTSLITKDGFYVCEKIQNFIKPK
jgi:hypothetical protein